jgi:hypothetical protein
MPSVYDPENYAGRVSLAAFYISQRRESSRAFDTCFEMYDGDAVAVALWRRAQAKPNSDLAGFLRCYLNMADIEKLATANAHRKNLTAWARELRAEGERATAAMFAELEARSAARREAEARTAYATELTPAGEQAVIPGCERQPVAGKPAQLSLFGG